MPIDYYYTLLSCKTMENNKEFALSMLNCSVDNNLNFSASNVGADYTLTKANDFDNTVTAGGTSGDSLKNTQDTLSCWSWWQDYYYPSVITTVYPVYVQERALDKGKKAYEIIKMLKDKKLLEITSVKKFMEMMDALINIL